MQNSGLQNIISVVASDGVVLSLLQDDPQSFVKHFDLGDEAAFALQSAETVLELDNDPLGMTTLTGGVTKCYADSPDFDRPLPLNRMTKKDLLRVLKISLQDERFAKRLRADLSL
jgi:hypothetical protein